jgi:hypothetical protein
MPDEEPAGTRPDGQAPASGLNGDPGLLEKFVLEKIGHGLAHRLIAKRVCRNFFHVVASLANMRQKTLANFRAVLFPEFDWVFPPYNFPGRIRGH